MLPLTAIDESWLLRASEDRIFRLLQVGQPKYCFSLWAFRHLSIYHTGGLPSRGQYGRSTGLDSRKPRFPDCRPPRIWPK